MKKRVLFLDIDGTLYDGANKCIPHSAKIALSKIYQDVDIYICTGRPYYLVHNIDEVREYIKGYVLVNGGCVVIDDKIVFELEMEKSGISKLIKEARMNDDLIGLVTTSNIYLYHMENPHDWMKRSMKENVLIDLKRGLFDETLPYVMGWLFLGNDQIDEYKKKIPELKFLKWGSFGCDITSCKTSKTLGMQKVIEYGHYDIKDVYAVGDGENDVEMLQMANLSCAMGNATEEVQKSANMVSKRVENDGLEDALIKLGLYKKSINEIV